MTPGESAVDSRRFPGTTVLGSEQESLGTVVAVARDRLGSPVWLVVDTDARRRVLVPVRAASLNAGGSLATPFDADTVAGAPSIEGDMVTEEHARAATAYYGLQE